MASCFDRSEIKSYQIKPEHDGPVVTWKLPESWGENPELSGPMAGSFHVKTTEGPKGRIGVMPFREAVSTLEIINMFGTEFGYQRFDENSLEQVVATKKIGDLTYEWIRLAQRGADSNPNTALLAILRKDSETWLFPFVGDAELVDQQLDNYVSFLGSFIARAGKVEIRATAPPLPPPTVSNHSLPTWEIPKHWVESSASSMRLASYEVSDENGNKLDFSVTSFPGDVGGTLANLNRWLGQIGIDPVNENQIGKFVSPITLDENPAQLVSAENDKQAFYAAILPLEGRSWFFKISGDLELARLEKENFLSFLESVCFH